MAFLGGSTFEVVLLVAWRSKETDGGGCFLSGWGRAGFDFWWADSFMAGVSAGDLCLVVSVGVVTAEHLGVLATALVHSCVTNY